MPAVFKSTRGESIPVPATAGFWCNLSADAHTFWNSTDKPSQGSASVGLMPSGLTALGQAASVLSLANSHTSFPENNPQPWKADSASPAGRIMYCAGMDLSRNARLWSQMVLCLPVGSLGKPRHFSWPLCPRQGWGTSWAPKGLGKWDHSCKTPNVSGT